MTAIDVLGRVFDVAVKPPYLRLRRALSWLLFERRYGVYTEARVPADELGLPDPHLTGYMPYGWLSLRRILPPRDVSPNDAFLDVGSGMGRVVLLAATMYPFRRVLGIELSTHLHEIAVTNLAANKERLRCQDVELQNADALDVELPDDVTVVFLYNTFTGPAFQAFIDRLLESVNRNPRPVRLIYANPKEETRLLATGRVRPVRSLRGLRPTAAWSATNSTRMYAILPPTLQQWSAKTSQAGKAIA
jgi:SAM-dependent methyltransferase